MIVVAMVDLTYSSVSPVWMEIFGRYEIPSGEIEDFATLQMDMPSTPGSVD